MIKHSWRLCGFSRGRLLSLRRFASRTNDLTSNHEAVLINDISTVPPFSVPDATLSDGTLPEGTGSFDVPDASLEETPTPKSDGKLSASELFRALGLPGGQDIEKIARMVFLLSKCASDAVTHPGYPALMQELALVLPQASLMAFSKIMAGLIGLGEKSEVVWQALVDRAVILQHDFGPRHLSQMLRILGRAKVANLEYVDRLIDMINERSAKQSIIFPPQSIAVLLQAYTYFEPMQRPNPSLLQSLLRYSLQKLNEFDDHSLASMAVALVKLGVNDNAFFKQLAGRLIRIVDTLATEHVANIMFCFAQGQISNPQFFQAFGQVANARRDFRVHALTKVLWADPSINLTSLIEVNSLPILAIPRTIGAFAKRQMSFQDEKVQCLLARYGPNYHTDPPSELIAMLLNLTFFGPEQSLTTTSDDDAMMPGSLPGTQKKIIGIIVDKISKCNRDEVCELLIVLKETPSLVTRSQIK